jgi:MFS transporter, DHA1 family, tetracycline resistance protein
LLPLIGVYLVIAVVGEIGATVWTIHGQDRYDWSPFTVGISLAALGLFHAVVQAAAAGPLSKWLGEARATVFAIVCDASACVLPAFAGQGWVAIALIPLFCLGGVGDPALLSILSRRVDDDHQGRLQGVLTGATSLAAIIGPPLFAAVYSVTRELHPGTTWMLGGALYLGCAPVLIRFRQRTRGA